MTDKKALHTLELKEINEDGTFSGYGSVFGVEDYDGDIIERGAFTESLAQYKARGKMPKMLWQHNPHEIIGRWDYMQEDDKGLYVKGRLLMGLQRGREAYEMLKAGVMDAMSIGFNIAKYQPTQKGRSIEQLNLWEVSLVTWGANPEALITQVKARDSIRDFERFLRDAGFSRSEAVAIAAKGYKALSHQSESETGDVDESLVIALDKLKQSIRGQTDGTENRSRGSGPRL